MKKIIAVLLLIITLSSCDVLNQIGGAFQLTQCEYKYNNIDNIQLAGLSLGDGTSLSLSSFASLSSILMGGNMQSIPFSMNLMLDVKNPNQATALLNGLDYSIQINDLELSTGKVESPLRIEAGQTSVLPIHIGVDLKKLMDTHSRDKVSKEMSKFLGISSNETKVTLKLWPKVMVGKTLIKVPTAIPVSFSFGGESKKK